MVPFVPITRRTFLADLGRGAGALVVLGAIGCAPGRADVPASTSPAATPGGPGTSPGGTVEPGGPSPNGSSGPDDGVTQWRMVDLGFVSAYVLFRAGEAAIVDTGVEGSADDIEAALIAAGLAWDAVGHVVLTHRHGDHVGSVDEVLARAAGATGYAGVAELSSIGAARDLVGVEDGADVFGLQVIATPGHTAGHIAVRDPVAGILVAGDALNTSSGQVTGANPQFSSDMVAANASVVKLAGLSFETLLVGHGDPIDGGASDLVATLAAGL